MITRAYIMRGIGDSLNARDFLIHYCRQHNIPQQNINIYTSIHKEIFEDTKFKIYESDKINPKELNFYGNFGHFDLPKQYKTNRYDISIAINSQTKYNFNKVVPLNWKADISNIELPKRFVTVNYGHDNNTNPLMKCIKMWSLEYWNELVKNIGVDCVQIGAGWSCKNIDGVKLNLVNKLTLKQSAEVMKRALFHIDIEGGLVILGQHIGVKSVVLFGATDIRHFAREGNLNLRNSNCPACSGNIDNDKHLSYPLYVYNFRCKNTCMKDLKPQYVIEQIKLKGWL